MKNLTRTTKILLFASLITTIAIPFTTGNFVNAEEVYDGTEIKDTFIQLEPYVTITDEKKILFDNKSAKNDGLDKKVIKIGKEYAKLQNDMVNSFTNGDTVKLELDKKQAKKFEEFFKKVKHGGDDKFSTPSIIPVEHASSCNVWGPHDQPDAVPKVATFTPITLYLIYNEYHQVQVPYSVNPSIDYAKKTTAYGCDDGVFREQAIIRSSSTYDTYNPEPNSEIFDYIWPSWWWGPYVFAWHGLN